VRFGAQSKRDCRIREHYPRISVKRIMNHCTPAQRGFWAVGIIMKLELLILVAFILNGCLFGGSVLAHDATAPEIKLKFVSVDSEETEGENGSGENAVDGDPNTYWHTQWKDKNPELPHEIIIELLPPSVIEGFTYLPRQDESDHGTIKDYEFFVSTDATHFGKPVKTGAFEPGRGKKTVTLAPIKCRFIKLRARSEINGLSWTSAAEIGVIPSREDVTTDGAREVEPPLSVSLAIPSQNGERIIGDRDRNPHFHVIVSNTSDTPRRIWRESCSQGWFGLSFEFKDENGEKWVATKKARAWKHNVPDCWTLKPHESFVIDVPFADPEVWQGFPDRGNTSRTITMQAILEFKPDEAGRQHGIWNGRIVSQAEAITFCHSPIQDGE
jgi:hypothetical protein